jgi:hypothetical protein
MPGSAGSDGRRHTVMRDGTLALELWFGAGEFRFTEAYDGGTEYRVSASLSAVPALADAFGRRLDLPPSSASAEDRLLACVEAMAAAGRIGHGLPRQGSRAVMAAWMAAAGVPATLSGFVRVEQVLVAPATGMRLTLTMDATASDHGIVFSETRDTPAACFRVRAPYACLPDLLSHLEDRRRPREGDLEERLTRCFRRLVATGVLAPGRPPAQARDVVAALFREAGAPVDLDAPERIGTD